METQKDRILGLVLSILLHIFLIGAILLPLVSNNESTPAPTKKSNSVELTNDVSSDKRDEVYTAEIVEASVDKEGEKCTSEKHSYIGIGIMYTYTTYTITQAPAGYPAAQAGIKVGDVYVDSVMDGNIINIEVKRDGVPLKFAIKTQPICYQE